ncbi:MAG: RusA family crossover junction endodeoxyribonuclease [Ruminococcus sp.]|nr:RusA family crossover junction endodeoxyribonuclease [Ruminococcus sp.]
MTITFTVPGKPEGKQRPRGTKSGRHYTPKKTVEYEKKVKACYVIQGGKHFEGAVFVGVTAYVAIPKSTTKKQRALIEAGKKLPEKKPDVDNILKIVLDALNGVAYDDDKQVTSSFPRKRYAYGDHKTECIVVTIREDSADDY